MISCSRKNLAVAVLKIDNREVKHDVYGQPETAGSCLRENSLILTCLVPLRSCLISGANRTEMS